MRTTAPGLTRMCRMNASNAVIKTGKVRLAIPFLPLVSHGDLPKRIHADVRCKNAIADRVRVTKLKQFRAGDESTISRTQGRLRTCMVPNIVLPVAKRCQVVALGPDEFALRQRNILIQFISKQSWLVTNIAPRLIRVYPECGDRGNLVRRWHDAVCVCRAAEGVAE